LVLNSCSLYKQHKSTASVPDNLYTSAWANGEPNIGQMEWHSLFTDPQLQALIETALTNNPDIQTAMLNLQKAEISYKTSRLAYLPTFAFSPTGSASKNINAAGNTWNYNLGVKSSWQLDIFGAGITNAKRSAKAAMKYSEDYKQAVECRLISSVAQLYYQLLGLEKQLLIQQQTLKVYEQTYESVQVLFESGQYTSAAVNQTKAELEAVKVATLQIEESVGCIQREICMLLNEPSHELPHGNIDDVRLPDKVGIGVAADLLKNRPDVRAAERHMEMAYYDMLINKGNLYPNITISANGSWGHPETWFIEGIGSLVQPIFQGGRLRANLKIAKLDQQIALVEFRDAVINAGYEVENALHSWQLAQKKASHLEEEVNALSKTVMATQELMNNGTSTYLEVLVSLEKLLAAQNERVNNQSQQAQALVALYAALGGR